MQQKKPHLCERARTLILSLRPISIFLLSPVATSLWAEEKSAVSFDISSIDEIPDLVQTDPAGKFARGGKSFCGPVSVSNSLVWLQAGAKGAFTDTRKQYEVVNLLASSEYMDADPVEGVGPVKVLRGVSRFVEQNLGDSDYTLAYQGWRSTPKGYFSGVREPEIEWIHSFVGRGKSAWINLGWYRYDKATKEYERIGGHWVTVVGYGVEKSGKPNRRILVIHDPSPRTGKDPHDYVLLTELKEGTMKGRKPRSVRGLYQMEGGMHIKSSADVAILDGVVGLNLDGSENTQDSQ